MRIICKSMDAFIANLQNAEVFQKKVWLERSYRWVHEHKRMVNIQASAVIIFSNEAEALLQFGMDCGVDLLDGRPDEKGTLAADKASKLLSDYCLENNLTICPGFVEV